MDLCGKPLRYTEAVPVQRDDGVRVWSAPLGCDLLKDHDGRCANGEYGCSSRAVIQDCVEVRCKRGANHRGIDHRYDGLDTQGLPYTIIWNECCCKVAVPSEPGENDPSICARCGGKIKE